ncbi:MULTISPECIES: aromatic-ring-hydroxylating dioxygenase subunit beta [unclassified Burkholderia]|uniref:aromatic-ring-hydroxylating dioxygenase subunit beta n=1 Tax=unclassified Burkholderia TaxID=2613784 RepID=UPI000F58E3E0|nr:MULTISPECIES: aromatic-ring-hydroxylating dioxygenase subunit beta [unclassified Burkholderia]RQR76555.1 aromatic-ring-hydroxylating dioxygenase [Burkholderia sp. Bp9011]RQR87309.1 aromatic-ring-hydroxylating dioxygenase [Burkholderia sp. Bp9010]RQS69718.1 aromatic-ring-hydroxylating dioxygenase [Burkholderia sp. Bp8977]
MNVQASRDPSRFSYYMTDEFYQKLVADFSEWQQDDRIVPEASERDAFRSIIEREARLLDQQLFEDWLNMFVRECVYWAPSTRNQGDPRSEIAVMFDDRRRLEDRVYRLRTGHAWSQAPASRTARLITNVEVFEGGRADVRMVRANFLISEFWDNETRILTGWAGYRMQRDEGGWKISAKQINLINCDQCIRNPSIIL